MKNVKFVIFLAKLVLLDKHLTIVTLAKKVGMKEQFQESVSVLTIMKTLLSIVMVINLQIFLKIIL